MKIGIMQPYFFPYLGYISLIKHTERFILLDEVQFIRHGWIERNRILKQNEGWLYIKVPLAKIQSYSKIQDCVIKNDQNWKQTILAQLVIYKKIAPYYFQVIKLLNKVFESEYITITELNKEALIQVCHYLGFDRKIEVFSEMNLQIEEPTDPDDWALNICKAIGNVDEYWNPPGGIDFFDRRKYELENIKLVFQRLNIRNYDQKRPEFIQALSILDVMMFNSVDDINKMLDNYELI